MQKLLMLSLVAGATVALNACTDTPTSPDTHISPATVRGAKVAEPQPEISERPTVSRFSVTLEASGPFTPGKPIDISVTTTNNLDTRDADVSILVPEAAEARRRGWKHGAAAVGTRVLPEFRDKRILQAGASRIGRTSIRFDAPGLYRVIANVAAAPDAPIRDQGRMVQNVASQEIWISVDAKGGKTQRKYDRSLVPDGMVAEPGPTMMIIPICDELNPCDPPPDDPPPPPTYSVLVTYFNNDESRHTVDPLKNVTVSVSDYPNGATYTGQTDNAGRFSVPCPANPGGSQRIVVTAATPGQFQVQNYWSSAVWTLADVVEPAGFCTGGATTTVQATDIGASWLHQQMLATVQPSRNVFQISRGFVGVNYDVDNVESNSLYRPDIDQIVIIPSHLYSEFGRFAVSHEYGHAFAQASLSGARSGCPASGHALDGGYTMGCALSEGWADYHSAIVRRSEIPNYYAYLLYNSGFHGGDGSTVESAYANFLLVLSSPDPITRIGSTPSVDIALHYPPLYIASTMRDCRSRYMSSPLWLVAGGSDQIVWCFEGGVDWGVYPNYFTTRGPNYNFWPALQSNAAARPWNWSQGNIRTAWLRSLYRVGI